MTVTKFLTTFECVCLLRISFELYVNLLFSFFLTQQSDQIKKKGLFDRDSQQSNHVSVTSGNTAYCNSSSVATACTQARRQTLKHSASNELPSTKKQASGT